MNTFTEKLDFLIGCFGENHAVSRTGSNVAFQCPACGKGTGKLKFSICLDTFKCHCWVCGIKGKTPYYFIKEYCGKERALLFKNNFSININDKEIKSSDDEKIDVVSFPSRYLMLATVGETSDPDIRDCIKYLNRRGVTRELMWRHKIGVFSGNRWSRRVVFPSFNKDGVLDFYVTRAIDDDKFLKYVNCKADKKKIAFDEIRINWKKEVMIVEGVFDMVKCGPNTLCILGSSLSEESYSFKKIIENQTPVVLGLDSDMKTKTYKIAKKLMSFGVPVRMFDTGLYHDVGSMPLEIIRQNYESAPIYSRESRLQHLIGTISSGSIF